VDGSFMLERGINFPVEGLLGYLFAQERLIRHVLFTTLMIIMLVVLINCSQWVKINAAPTVVEKQGLYNKNLEMTDKLAFNQGALFSLLLPHFFYILTDAFN
jgi:hypothetical protein